MEQTLSARIRELCLAAERSGAPRFCDFLPDGALDECEAACRAACAKTGGGYLLYGGYDGAMRRVAGLFPPGMPPRTDRFPITAFSARIPRGFTLTHRDFLGALLALGIKREVVGDILIEGENAFFFTLSQAAPLVLDELSQVGRVGVRVRGASPDEVEAAGIRQQFEESDVSVSSLRLDCVVAALAHLSRQNAAALIASGLVQVDGAVCERVTHPLSGARRVTVRGKGKFLVEPSERTTKRGRLVLHVKRYL